MHQLSTHLAAFGLLNVFCFRRKKENSFSDGRNDFRERKESGGKPDKDIDEDQERKGRWVYEKEKPTRRDKDVKCERR